MDGRESTWCGVCVYVCVKHGRWYRLVHSRIGFEMIFQNTVRLLFKMPIDFLLGTFLRAIRSVLIFDYNFGFSFHFPILVQANAFELKPTCRHRYAMCMVLNWEQDLILMVHLINAEYAVSFT